MYFTLKLITKVMFILSIYEDSELKVFKNIKFLGEISTSWPNDLLGTKVHKTLESCLELLLTQGRRKLFYGGGLSKNISHLGWLTTKDLKKKHWLKRPKAVPKKWNLDHNKNDSKSHTWNSCFENFILGIHVPVDFIRVLFLNLRFSSRGKSQS